MRNPFRYFNASLEVIRLTVMMYIRFPLSLRQVERILFERGIDMCHETVRLWWNRFGPLFAAEIWKGRVHHQSYSNWRQHLDEVSVKINGEMHYLWRAVDHEGEVLEVTDRLRSDGAALKEIGIAGIQVCGRWFNNRAQNSHPPFRRRQEAIARFRDIKTLQIFASAHASVHNLFNLERHLTRRSDFKLHRSAALAEWRQLAA